jgi:hypothetical protein
MGALALTSGCSTPTGVKSTTVAYQPGVPGGVVVQTIKVTATVTGIDAATRKVTLVSPEGRKTIFKAGPEVVNFSQIQIGDQVRATLIEELVVSLGKKDEPSSEGQASSVALAAPGTKPGVIMADTVQITAKVTALDLKRHRATLQFADGTTKTIDVRKDVDMTKRALGEEVVIRCTESLAIMVEKP